MESSKHYRKKCEFERTIVFWFVQNADQEKWSSNYLDIFRARVPTSSHFLADKMHRISYVIKNKQTNKPKDKISAVNFFDFFVVLLAQVKSLSQFLWTSGS